MPKGVAEPAAVRFWRFVNKDGPIPGYAPHLGPCWLWTGGLDHYGYGSFRVLGRAVKAHTWAYEQIAGPIPTGLEPDHLCRVTACVRPDHLEPVTHAENVRRGRAGAHKAAKTHCPQGHPYEGENLYVDHRGRRRCRTCIRAGNQRWWASRG